MYIAGRAHMLFDLDLGIAEKGTFNIAACLTITTQIRIDTIPCTMLAVSSLEHEESP
jgi:hypothetical protein